MVFTSRILTTTHVDFIICPLLSFLTHHISFTLLSNNLVDESFLALEVITHFFRLIRSFSIFEHRQTRFHSRAIGYTTCIDCTAVHVHGDDFRGQFNLFIIHLTLTVQMGETTFRKYNGVIGFIHHRCIQRFFLFLASDRIKRHRIRS